MKTIKSLFKEVQKLFPEATLQMEIREVRYYAPLSAAGRLFHAKYGGVSVGQLYGESVLKKKDVEMPVIIIGEQKWSLKRLDGSKLKNKNLERIFESIKTELSKKGE